MVRVLSSGSCHGSCDTLIRVTVALVHPRRWLRHWVVGQRLVLFVYWLSCSIGYESLEFAVCDGGFIIGESFDGLGTVSKRMHNFVVVSDGGVRDVLVLKLDCVTEPVTIGPLYVAPVCAVMFG